MKPRRARIAILVAACAALAPSPSRAHEFALDSVVTAFVAVEPGEAHLVIRIPLHVAGTVRFPLVGRAIDVARAGPAVERALGALARDVALFEDGRRLAPSSAVGRLSLPSDRSFEGYTDAVRHVAQPADPGTPIYADQGFLDAHLTFPIASEASRFAIRTAIAPELKEFLKVTVRYLPRGGDSRAMVITSRSGTVALDPAWYQAAAGFVALGIGHILSGLDHLLFLLCLVIPLRGWRRVLPIVTAFTVAHSFTLIGSAYGLAPSGAWFPPFVEAAIAASIVYMALENVVGVDTGRRWVVAGLFGLVHGFGFSYALKESLQFAGAHLLVALFSFNVGIELGQLAVLAAMVPALAFLRRHVRSERAGVIVLSALVAHTGWHWMTERGAVLWRTPWPQLDAAALTVIARWVAGLLLAAAAVRLAARRGLPARLARRAAQLWPRRGAA